MINYSVEKCPKCGKIREIMISNNPLNSAPICFDCINSQIDPHNLNQADLFCRTFNLPMQPDLWMQITNDNDAQKKGDKEIFKTYTSMILEDETFKPNLYYSSSTRDIWLKVNHEWEKSRSLKEILLKLDTIRDSYTTRGQLKWGDQYTFSDIVKLDAMYVKTLKSNNIINPMQKEALKTLCKLQLQIDDAIRTSDSKGLKEYSAAYGVMAKQAGLENMIETTKSSNITTLSEMASYLEDTGFKYEFYDGFPRDEVDRAINDINNANRKTILECTQVQPLIEERIRKDMEAKESAATKEAQDAVTLQEMMNFNPDDVAEVQVEDDSEVQNIDFSSEEDTDKLLEQPVKVSHKETKELTGMKAAPTKRED